MIYGYARVSTVRQAKDGNSIEYQEMMLRQQGCEKIYCDNFTGTKEERPEFSKLLKVLKEGDTLCVTKLDRFARSVMQGTRLIDELMERGVRINILNLGVIDNTSMGRLIRTILLGIAEFERDMIVERTREGKSVARLKDGYREGRPKKEVREFEYFYGSVQREEMTLKEALSRLAISKSSWYRLVKARGC